MSNNNNNNNQYDDKEKRQVNLGANKSLPPRAKVLLLLFSVIIFIN